MCQTGEHQQRLAEYECRDITISRMPQNASLHADALQGKQHYMQQVPPHSDLQVILDHLVLHEAPACPSTL